MFDTETATEQVVDQTTEALESQVAEILEQEVVSADATPAEELNADETPKDSVGLVNLRNHVESLESDINNVYKPAYQVVDKFGGAEVVEDGMSLYTALQEYEADKAASNFLDKVYELSPDRYNAVVQNIFQTHGQDWLKAQGQDPQKAEDQFNWKESLDDSDPVKTLIQDLQTQLRAAQEELNATKGKHQQETEEQQKEARLREFFQHRYNPLETALSSLDFGEDTKWYRDAIRRTVEGQIEEHPELSRLFQESAEMVRDGNGKLAASRIAEFDRRSAEIINETIQKFTSRYTSESAAIKNKIENSNLPKATEPAPAAPVRAVPVMKEGAKAFDDESMLSRLRALEASGRLPAR